MRIAVLASNFIRLPPDPPHVPDGFSGAPERVMLDITEELVRRGHQVTLFASGDSVTSAKLVSVTRRATGTDPAIGIGKHTDWEHLLVGACYRMAREGAFDVIHSIFDVRSATYAGLVDTPTVVTMHSPMEGKRKAILEKIPDTQWYVSISNAQRKGAPGLRYAATVYHGIDASLYPYSEEGGEALFLAGRMVERKGVEEALDAAAATDTAIVLAGTPVTGDPFWIEKIAPRVDDNAVRHTGFVDTATLATLYRGAKAYLFPVKWEEPFGLVLLQAMASGTPVVAYANGSIPEIVKDGEVGFIVNESEANRRGDWTIRETGVAGLIAAIQRIRSMPPDAYRAMRRRCRDYVANTFTIGAMVDGYERVYRELIAKRNG